MKLRLAPILALFLFAACPGDDDAPADQVDADTSAEVDAGADASPDAELPASCTDGVKNGDEGGVDCGGGCEALCATWSACQETSDCQADHFCTDDNSSQADNDSTCRPVVASCEGDACGPDAFCRQIISSINDVEAEIYFCEPRYAAGATCFEQEKDVNTCVDGQVCINSTCEPTIAQDAACDENLSRCAPGLACTFSSETFESTCQPAKQANEDCFFDSECGTGLHCDEFRKACEPRAAKDAACYEGDIECAVGLECQFATVLACEDWVDCGGNQNYCCATEGGAECRLIEEGPVCEPPAGKCEINTWLDGDL